ncbi:hypothetical protein [Coleofasciculus sp. FACHB-SPT9]|nr:hypothetical protein [Coleofasciculus sp. FACHB-SPT9]
MTSFLQKRQNVHTAQNVLNLVPIAQEMCGNIRLRADADEPPV